MSLKSILCELKEMKGTIRSKSTKRIEGKSWHGRSKIYIGPKSIKQGQWANLPPGLLLEIILRLKASETTWPAGKVIIFCASVCRSWRDITKEVVKTPEECGKLTFPISLKLPGPRDEPIRCFIKRDKTTTTYSLHYGLEPSEDEDENNKLLLAAKKIKRVTSKDFMISLVGNDFSRASSAYVGKLRSNFLGNKFTIYDVQPPNEAAVKNISRESPRFNAKQVSPRLPAYNYHVATICYELHVIRSKVPRKMHCVMLSIPASSVQDKGNVPGPKSFSQWADEKSPSHRPRKETSQLHFSKRHLL